MQTATENAPVLPIKKKSPPRSSPLIARILQNRSSAIGLIFVGGFVIIGLLAGFGFTPFPVTKQHPLDRLQAPNQQYLLGTDQFGRDVASRVMKGATNSLTVAALSVAISSVLGTVIGVVSGYLGGHVDFLFMRGIDILFAFPALLLALLVVVVLGPGMNSTILAIATVYTPIFARIARAPVLSLKETEFVLATKCVGARGWRTLVYHILPNMIAPLIIQVTLALSWALITEAGLSFLGLGTQQPEPSWGLMLSSNRALAERAPWLILYPALAIMLSVLGFNLLGDGLRDALDPKRKRRF